MKKKVIGVLLTAAMTASLLAGCGGSSGETASGTESATESTEADTTEADTAEAEDDAAEASEDNAGASAEGADSITYWSMWNSTEGQAKAIQEAADAYEAATGIHVNIEWKGRDVRTMIGAALDAGENIDLFDTDYAILIQQNSKYLADLTDMAAAVGYEDHIMPVILDKAKEFGGGTLYALPYQPYTTGVWYDKAMFEAAGIDKVPETFDELLDVCEKLKASGVNPMTCNSDTALLLYGFQLARYIGQEGVSDVYSNGNWSEVPEALKAAQDIQTLWVNGYMSEYAPAQYPDGQNEIGFGESCMILNASWIPNEILQNTGTEVDFGFFPWPAVEGGVDGIEASMVGAQGFGVVASGNQQAAFDFAYSICTGEYDLKMAEAVKSIPADVDNQEWPAVISGAEPYFKNMTKAYNWAVGLEDDAEIADILRDNFIKMVKQEMTPEQFIEEMSK